MNHIIEELIKNGIQVVGEFNIKEERPEFVITGFYKSGEVRLIETDGKLIAHTRYNQQDEIETIYDIVVLNYKWWISSKDRFDGWKNPESNWIPLLEKYNLIVKKVDTVTTYH